MNSKCDVTECKQVKLTKAIIIQVYFKDISSRAEKALTLKLLSYMAGLPDHDKD